MFRITGKIKEIEDKIEGKKQDGAKLEIVGQKVPVFAAETVEIKAGEIKPINISKICLPKKTVLMPSAYIQHKLGNMVSLGEETPVPFEHERCLEYAIFVAVKEGTIKEGELVGTIVVLHAE
ncbi:hypothetical protein HNP93_000683 [Methanococcus maripaludis]|uniref:DUF22 domain-containing protein n=1 Tax=Methanococcus maripaludis TaxID=39152 RepID=A0A7J9P447_METMI|nr:DUF22 domain-containing protein [Methanococcus maripaludis]MBA2857982.1 hypothetical protein [Methanococcus maripaludis]